MRRNCQGITLLVSHETQQPQHINLIQILSFLLLHAASRTIAALCPSILVEPRFFYNPPRAVYYIQSTSLHFLIILAMTAMLFAASLLLLPFVLPVYPCFAESCTV